MYWEKRKDRNGKIYYSFIQWDPVNRRNVRLKRSIVPTTIDNDLRAAEFCKLRESENDAAAVRIERKLNWKKKFYDFEELLPIFEKEARDRAPNSYPTMNYYLRHYAFDYFLNQKQCNNLNNWSLYFEDFRDWLLNVKTSNSTKNNTLAYSSKNNVIGAVNLFLEIMYKKGKCGHSPKCQKFSKHFLTFRSADHVINSSESHIVMEKLREIDSSGLASDFFSVLLHTGLRLSEGLSLSLNDFYPGLPDNKIIKGALERHSLRPYGYISIESQLTNSAKPRSTDGKVSRKPLKGRKRIEAKFSRIIPLVNKHAYNSLARRFNAQSELFDKITFGKDKSNYLLFDGLDKNRFSRLLREAYEQTKFTHKSPHCCRHTFATNFAGLANGDTGLCRLVLGHRDEDTTLGYVHLFEQINRESRAKELVRNKIDLIE